VPPTESVPPADRLAKEHPDAEFDKPVLLVGMGVVGLAIARDHIRAGVPFWMADQEQAVLRDCAERLLRETSADLVTATPWGTKLPIPNICVIPNSDVDYGLTDQESPEWLVIESIAERLDVKQSFYRAAESWFDRPPVWGTNTSTLPIGRIAERMICPDRLLGFHFFMPVVGRHAVEMIPHGETGPEAVARCRSHAASLGKFGIEVADAPGFVVNRMLAPYLNLSLWLACGGVSFEDLRAAAFAYGMPMSPLELIDLIGARTAFDGGRVVWQAFPHRLDPSPLLPAMIKRGLLGRSVGKGFYEYDGMGKRFDDMPRPEVISLLERYRHDQLPPRDRTDVALLARLLAGVMRTEAENILRDGVTDRRGIDEAMSGGLGYTPPTPPTLSSTWWQWIERTPVSDWEQLADRFPKIRSLRCSTPTT